MPILLILAVSLHKHLPWQSQRCSWTSPSGSYYDCKMHLEQQPSGNFEKTRFITHRSWGAGPEPHSEFTGESPYMFMCWPGVAFTGVTVLLVPRVLRFTPYWYTSDIRVSSLVAQTVKSLQRGRPGFSPWVGKILWRRKWQPTPVFLPGKSHGQRSLAGCSPWGHKESDRTERLTHTHKQKSRNLGTRM